MNELRFGDCLDVLKDLNRKHPSGYIDLIYIDPPFNSSRNYNILFENVDLSDVKAQKEAFADTWSNISYLDTLNEIKEIDLDLFRLLDALNDIRISKSALSYLTTMAIRIWYMHKVLKDTGSFYLHCDPNMSHYLKVVCDLIFGKDNFRNEIVWKRTHSHGNAKRFGPVHDIILFYTKTNVFKWINIKCKHDEKYIDKFFKNIDAESGRKFQPISLTGAGISKGESGGKWRNIDVASKGRHWAIPQNLIEELGIKARGTLKTLDALDAAGYIYWPKKGGVPRLKHFADKLTGVSVQDIFDDIHPISAQAAERLGYPTQKPLALLERIINASSNEGDLVADFFCGCGTTVAAAQKLNRRWLGVDISHLAVRLVLKRLKDTYKENYREILKNIDIDGFPRDIASARELALTERGRIKFQDWVVEVLIGGISNPKKSGEGGEDGHVTFPVSPKKSGVGIVEVKSGNANVASLRSFITSVKQKKADMGVFACFDEKITSGMRREAKEEGTLPNFSSVDRIQILGIEELMNGKEVQLPGHGDFNHFRSAARYKEDLHENGELF